MTLCKGGEGLPEYPFRADGIKNERFSPERQPEPRYKPNNRKKPTQQEENRLRAMSESVAMYLDRVLKPMGQKRHGFLRKLFALSRKTTPALFIESIERAHKYGISDIATVERIMVLNMTAGTSTLPFVEIDEDFRQRDTYLEGRLTDPPDLSIYGNTQEDDHE